MATTKTLKMSFEMSSGSYKTYSLLDPKTGLTMENVQTFGDLCITKNAIKVNNATAANLSDAYIEEVTRTELA